MVDLARRYGLLVTVRGGGHNLAGTAIAQLAVMLAGGGGNFGVITRFTFALHQVGPR